MANEDLLCKDKNTIRDILTCIWTNNIKDDYEAGLIPTEKHLQALLFHYLKLNLKSEYQIWVEPNMAICDENGQLRYDNPLQNKKPDLLISSGNDNKGYNLIAVIELKYRPNGDADYPEDIEKLNNFIETSFKGGYSFKIFTDPETGEWDRKKRITIGKELESVAFLVVANGNRKASALNVLGNAPKSDKFLHLRGNITTTNRDFDEVNYIDIIDN